MSTAEPVQLRIVTIFGLSVQINVAKDLSMTIGELKQKIGKSKIGSKREKQIIYFNDQQTDNSQTLKGVFRTSEFEVWEFEVICFILYSRNWCEH